MTPLLQTVLAEADARAKALKEARSGEAHFLASAPGQRGMMLILDDTNPMVGRLAAALGVTTGWKITSVGKGMHAAYSDGDRLSFAEFADDLQGDEDATD